MASLDGLEMESNVGRDVLSTASAFGSLPKVVAEYVSNSIDAHEQGQAVEVVVSKRRAYGATRIVIEDNACGMDSDDLRRFFYMHAENQARRRGRTVRGVFGTGKAAAFGIGSSLQVETVRNGRRWVVRLDKAELETAVREQRKPRPVVLNDGAITADPNGTTIIIDGVTKAVDESRVIKELQRRMGRHLQVHSVVAFGRPAKLHEPQARRSWYFEANDDSEIGPVIGNDVVCTINAALQADVPDELQGVIVSANDFPVAQLLATGDHAGRLFGHCDVPALEADESTPGPYTDTRDLTLNEDNATAGPLAAWIRRCLAAVTSELAAEARELRQRALDAALRNAASRMEAVLNRHFHGEFRRTRNPAGELGAKITGLVSDPNGALVRPGEGFAGYDISDGSSRDSTDRTDDQDESEEESNETKRRPRERDPFGEGRGEPLSREEEPRSRRRSGGFKIGFERARPEAPRSRYLQSELTILINLHHPEIEAAYREGDNSMFRMLAFEAAALEYSFATAYLRLDEDETMDAADILQYVRSTMETLTRDVSDVVSDLTTMPPVPMASVAATA